jgi:glycosyltransferase involved in cell wall biosynthesis
MRILLATDVYFPTPGGISTVVYRLAKTFADLGHKVAIIAPSVSWKFEEKDEKGFKIFRVRSLPLLPAKKIRYAPVFLYRHKIEEIIQTFAPDVIHIETINDIVAAVVQIAKKFSIPIVGTCHIMPENISGSLPFLPSRIGKVVGKLYMKQLMRIFNKVDFVTAPTQTGIAILDAYEIKTPSMALSNGIDLAEFREPSLEKKEAVRKNLKIPNVPLILYIGRIDKEKRVKILIEALALVPDSLSFHAFLVGSGNELVSLKNFVRAAHLENKITFVEFVSGEELTALYSVASFFVMPSTAELQSLVTMEAMALKLPVIGANAGALPYLIKDNQNGFLFEPDNSRDLAGKLIILLKDNKLREKMSIESFKLIQKHDVHVITRTWVELYQKLIKNKKQGKS